LETKLVKDLMVPLSGYATVSEDATLNEAVAALKQAQKSTDDKYPHRAVLIFDKNQKIVGKVTMTCVLRGLEPKYDEMLPNKGSYHLGLSIQFQKTMLEQLRLFDAPLDRICQKASDKKVKNFMIKPTEGEFIPKNASLNEAIHQLIMGNHQSLLVTEGKDIVGILKLTDVFEEVSELIATCKL
jgi:CBS domain-containing protein